MLSDVLVGQKLATSTLPSPSKSPGVKVLPARIRYGKHGPRFMNDFIAAPCCACTRGNMLPLVRNLKSFFGIRSDPIGFSRFFGLARPPRPAARTVQPPCIHGTES